jgi:hypothetical protein
MSSKISSTISILNGDEIIAKIREINGIRFPEPYIFSKDYVSNGIKIKYTNSENKSDDVQVAYAIYFTNDNIVSPQNAKKRKIEQIDSLDRKKTNTNSQSEVTNPTELQNTKENPTASEETNPTELQNIKATVIENEPSTNSNITKPNSLEKKVENNSPSNLSSEKKTPLDNKPTLIQEKPLNNNPTDFDWLYDMYRVDILIGLDEYVSTKKRTEEGYYIPCCNRIWNTDAQRKLKKEAEDHLKLIKNRFLQQDNYR